MYQSLTLDLIKVSISCVGAPFKDMDLKSTLLGMDIQELTSLMSELGVPSYRSKQIAEAVYRSGRNRSRRFPLFSLTSGTGSRRRELQLEQLGFTTNLSRKKERSGTCLAYPMLRQWKLSGCRREMAEKLATAVKLVPRRRVKPNAR